MKISPSLLQAIGLALLIPCTVAVNEVHAQEKTKQPVVRRDSLKVKPQQKQALKPIKTDTARLKKLVKRPDACPACGMG